MRSASTSAESRICSAAKTRWSRDVRRRFAAIGLTARVAIAPTAAAAWALAHYAPASRDARCADAKLAPLHVSALRLDAGHGPHARTAWAEDHRCAYRPSAACAGAAVPGRRECRRRARPDARPKPEALTASADRPAAARSLRLEEPATHPEAAARRSTADPRTRSSSWRSGISAPGGCRSRLSGRRKRRHRVGRDDDPQPRAEASGAAACRQGGGARSGLRLRCVRAGRRLDRGSGRRAGKPGRGAGRASAISRG